jgi:hypothetical protein
MCGNINMICTNDMTHDKGVTMSDHTTTRLARQRLELPLARLLTLPTPDGDIKVEGHVVGFASSHRDAHAHRSDEIGSTVVRCSACRWSEITIIIPTDDEAEKHNCQYIVHTYGPTIISDEINLCHLYYVRSAHQIIEILTVRRPNNVYLPRVAAIALADAAGYDRSIEDAYVNRAVA